MGGARLGPSSLDLVRRGRVAVVIGLGFLLLHLPINRAVSGSFWHNGYWMFNEGHGFRTLGFGLGPFGDPHTPAIAAAKSLSMVVRDTFYLAGGPWLLAPVALVAFDPRAPRRVWAAAPVVLVYLTGYFFYAACSIVTTGPVYYLPLVPVLAGWIAMAATHLHGRLASAPGLGRVVPSLLVAHVVAAAVVFWPSVARDVTRAADDAGRCEGLEALAEAGPALVFVQRDEPETQSSIGWPPLSSPLLDDKVLFAMSQGGARDREVFERFGKGRIAYLSRCLHHPSAELEPYNLSAAR